MTPAMQLRLSNQILDLREEIATTTDTDVLAWLTTELTRVTSELGDAEILPRVAASSLRNKDVVPIGFRHVASRRPMR